MLAAEGLGVRLGGRWLFRHVTFELVAGDVLGIFGPNGCGKSTLLRTLADLHRPSEGRVGPPESLGYAAVDQALYRTLTAREHLEFARDVRGAGRDPIDVLAEVELDYAADVRAEAMSSGMRARLRLALAIQHAPSALLLDEPSATLDEAGRRVVGRIIAGQRQRGTVVLATNDAAERGWATLALDLGEATVGGSDRPGVAA
ncbi:MAG: ABC transporter ATP-binding protein [Fimbriimonadaceae bacterium]|nr:ABC transporter ATP-binding protein [Fimbriimonadaceae bacterium]